VRAAIDHQDPVAPLALIRAQLALQRRQEARSLAHRLRDDPTTAEVGTLCSAVVATAEGFLPLAHELFARVPQDLALKHAPAELMSVLAEHDDVAAGVQACRRLLELGLVADRRLPELMDTASRALEAGRLNAARALWETARTRLWGPPDDRQQLDLAMGSSETERVSAGVRLAVIDPASPAAGWHPTDTALLTFLGQLARLTDTAWIEAANATSVRNLVTSLASPNPGRNPTYVALDVLDTLVEASDAWLASTWIVIHEARIDLELVRRLPALIRSERCLVLSIELVDARALTAELRSWLQHCGPVGCRTWSTVLLLRQAGVQAYFAGTLAVMAGSLVEPLRAWLGPHPQGAHAPATDPWRARLERAARRLLGDLDETTDRTTSVERYLHVLATGRRLKFDPKGEDRLRLEGLVDLSANDAQVMRTRLETRLHAVLGPITSSQPPETVAQAWRAACQADLAEADRYCSRYDVPPPMRLDIDRAVVALCENRREHRPPSAAAGAQIELAFAVDDKLAIRFPVVLESVIEHLSAPARAHLLMRGLDASYQRTLERDFGSAMGLVFHDFGSVDYGGGLRMLSHTTVSTLDRLLLPDLLPDLDRIIYLDADLLVRGDLADLWTLDLQSRRLAAKASSSPGARYVHQMVQHALAALPPPQAYGARRHLYDSYPMLCRAFNAGVLIMNLARMRSEDFARRFIPMVENYGMNDQDVLNVYAGAERLELDPGWNAIPRQDLTDGAKIVHFAGPVKPWSDLYIGRACDFKACESRYRARTGRASS
jgi:lipopolysaccharide biosynthesis glycosyltransferase